MWQNFLKLEKMISRQIQEAYKIEAIWEKKFFMAYYNSNTKITDRKRGYWKP